MTLTVQQALEALEAAARDVVDAAQFSTEETFRRMGKLRESISAIDRARESEAKNCSRCRGTGKRLAGGYDEPLSLAACETCQGTGQRTAQDGGRE